jgi:hypothetical protein
VVSPDAITVPSSRTVGQLSADAGAADTIVPVTASAAAAAITAYLFART